MSIELLIIPIAFILGGFLTSWILDRNYSSDKIPNYPIVQSLITILLGTIAILVSSGTFETSVPLARDGKSICLIGLLCLVCGMKNALTTWASYGKIRTTHLTGLSTDIGLQLPKFFRSEESKSRYPEPKRVTYVRIITLVSFSFGSCIAGALVPIIGYKIFYLTFGISSFLLAVSVIHRQKLQQAIYIDQQLIGEPYANTQ